MTGGSTKQKPLQHIPANRARHTACRAAQHQQQLITYNSPTVSSRRQYQDSIKTESGLLTLWCPVSSASRIFSLVSASCCAMSCRESLAPVNCAHCALLSTAGGADGGSRGS